MTIVDKIGSLARRSCQWQLEALWAAVECRCRQELRPRGYSELELDALFSARHPTAADPNRAEAGDDRSGPFGATEA